MTSQSTPTFPPMFQDWYITHPRPFSPPLHLSVFALPLLMCLLPGKHPADTLSKESYWYSWRGIAERGRRGEREEWKSHTVAADALPSSTNSKKSQVTQQGCVTIHFVCCTNRKSPALDFYYFQRVERQFANHADFQLSFRDTFVWRRLNPYCDVNGTLCFSIIILFSLWQSPIRLHFARQWQGDVLKKYDLTVIFPPEVKKCFTCFPKTQHNNRAGIVEKVSLLIEYLSFGTYTKTILR